jgi:hypothetical protein
VPPDVEGLHRDEIVHADGAPYLERFHVVASKAMGVRYHHWLSSDARDPHDHPWPNVTVVLEGILREHTAHGVETLSPGSIMTRPAKRPHRIELVTADAWTLFVHGPMERRWGFITDQGWVYWQEWPEAGRYVDALAT